MVTKSKLIYVSHFLSSWGDRMWKFAVALFLMDLASDTLLLPAVYGVTLAATILMFAPLVGNLIDRSPRLRAAQVALVTQNTAVAVCAVILLIQKLYPYQSSGYLVFVKIFAIILGAIALLASTASTIIIQKDWIVVIAGNDKDVMAKLNSVLRRIDLSTKLLAPLVCGQVMTLVSLTFGCGFIAGWNVVSMFVEYILLRVVYNRTPALAHKKTNASLIENQEDEDHDDEMIELQDEDVPHPGDNPSYVEEDVEMLGKRENETDGVESSLPPANDNQSLEVSTEKTSCFHNVFSFILVIPKGWKLYMSQPVAKAGIGMSFLYMTVLGFDAITVSYAYHQCFSELLVGILMACSAVTGILSTFLFPPLCSKFGVVRTGSISSIAQILSLLPCVVSVFTPGSPFFLKETIESSMGYVETLNVTELATTPSTITPSNFTANYYNTTVASTNDGVFLKCIEGIPPPPSYISLSLLMTGSILARIGLWGFDLAITQLYQIHVAENERGIVNGVQSSLNNLMDLLHFFLVIAMPSPDQFGILVILSALFVCIGHLFYALFSKKQTGSFCFG